MPSRLARLASHDPSELPTSVHRLRLRLGQRDYSPSGLHTRGYRRRLVSRFSLRISFHVFPEIC